MADQEVLIVTGAGRGIGAAIARLAAARGYAVAVNYAASVDPAEALVRTIEAAGGTAAAFHGDVAIEADVIRLFDAAAQRLGPIRALVNNAGITGGFTRAETIDADRLARMLAVNVTGTILCAREAVRRLSTRLGGSGGAIVNISSLAARTGGAGEWIHYAASKGAVNSFTLGLAREVADQGIRVNAVAPGLVVSDLHARNGAPDRVERMAPSIPMRRGGMPEEVAEGCCGCCHRRHPIRPGRSSRSGAGGEPRQNAWAPRLPTAISF